MAKSKSPSAPVVLAGMPKQPGAPLDHAPIVNLLMEMLTGLAAERSVELCDGTVNYWTELQYNLQQQQAREARVRDDPMGLYGPSTLASREDE